MLFPKDKLIGPGNREYGRLTTDYEDNSERFRFERTNDYSKQFAHIYASRLEQMRILLTTKAVEKWGEKIPVKKMFELREDTPEKCIIIGTLFKHQALKPSILREISEETQLAPQPARFKFADEGDQLILEDELQRIRLFGKLDVHRVVTGIVCALLGYEEGDGKFMVEDYLFYECGPQPTPPDLQDSPLLVLVSGLDQSTSEDISLPLELLQQWMFGNIKYFGDSANEDWEAASIVRIIVAGNSIRSAVEVRQRSNQMRQPESAKTLQSVESVDEILANWSKTVPVDLMSGEFDPANCMLPQQPMHRCMFPKCSASELCRGVTNPYDFSVADRRIVGTSGQNVDDIIRFSQIERPLDALRSSLIWSHVAPTCPDTLPCFPYYKRDPFVLTECPHVYFSGNSSEFATEIREGSDGSRTCLVCVPAFTKTKSVAVVNLRTLECKELTFHLSSYGEMEE